MASPQRENGYTAIANELMDALIKANLSGTQQKIMLIIARETYGFNRKTVLVGYQALATRYGISRSMLIREMTRLVKMQCLLKIEGSVNAWGIQKDYEKWIIGSHSTETSAATETSHQNGQRLVTPQRPVTSHSTETTSKQEKAIKTKDQRADAPRPVPKPQSKPTRDPNLDHPAVKVYQDHYKLTPDQPQRALIAECISDLALWEVTMTNWDLSGNKPTNVLGMTDWYKLGGQPYAKRNGKPNGQPQARAPAQPDGLQMIDGKLYRKDGTPYEDFQHSRIVQ